jgi:hypothetical protein
MIRSPFPGFFGPQAVITVVLGDVVSVEIKKKAAPEVPPFKGLLL